MSDLVEKVARAWASIDGKLGDFKRGKVDAAYDRVVGRYGGYMADAEELLSRSGTTAHIATLEAQLAAADRLAEAIGRQILIPQHVSIAYTAYRAIRGGA